MNSKERYIGLMSGSSLDGVDIVLVEFTNDRYQVVDQKAVPYPPEWEDKLRSIKSFTLLDFFMVESQYSTLLAKMIKENIDLTDVKAVGIHGHTISHLPEENITIQLGNGGIIASELGLDTVIDFRIQDVVLGGKGTPLVSILEKNVLKSYDYFLNLGGIANMTILGEKISAYDVCGCNQVLNHLANKIGKKYDDNGQIAASGEINHTLLKDILDLDYHHLPCPKAIDNQWIKDVLIPLVDGYEITESMTTFVESIAILLSKDLKKEGKMLVTGGGAFNGFLIERMQKHLSPKNIKIVLPDKLLIEYKEAILMAYLASCRVNQVPNVLSDVTGASRDSCAGAWYKAKTGTRKR